MRRRRSQSWSRRRRRGLYPWSVIQLPWGRNERRAYLFWRIRIPLWALGGACGWALFGAAGLAGGLAAAYVAEGVLSYGKPAARRPVSATAQQAAAQRAQAQLTELRWERAAVPSPAGWRPATGARPGWQWAPPDGLRARLDRVPVLVRLWYKTPLVDRYACSWMWEHGGWDVLPPGATDGQA